MFKNNFVLFSNKKLVTIKVFHINFLLILWGITGTAVGCCANFFTKQTLLESFINWLVALIPGIVNHTHNTGHEIELTYLWSFYFVTMPIVLLSLLNWAKLKPDYKKASYIKKKYNLNITAFKKKMILSLAYLTCLAYLFVGIEQKSLSKGFLMSLYQNNLIFSFFVTWVVWSGFIYFSLIIKEVFFSD